MTDTDTALCTLLRAAAELADQTSRPHLADTLRLAVTVVTGE